MIALFLKQVFCLNALVSQGGDKKKEFLSLLFLKNNRPELIPLPKRYNWGGNFALLQGPLEKMDNALFKWSASQSQLCMVHYPVVALPSSSKICFR